MQIVIIICIPIHTNMFTAIPRTSYTIVNAAYSPPGLNGERFDRVSLHHHVHNTMILRHKLKRPVAAKSNPVLSTMTSCEHCILFLIFSKINCVKHVRYDAIQIHMGLSKIIQLALKKDIIP